MAATTEGMGFLSELLASHDEVEMDSLMLTITQVGEKISSLKFRVKEMIEETYVDFSQLPHEHRALVSEAKALTGEIDNLAEEVETKTKRNLRNSTSELKKLSVCLQEITLTSTIVNQLVDLDNTLQKVTKLQDDVQYCEMAKTLQRAQEILSVATEHNKDLELFKALAKECSRIGGNFLEDMMNMWGDCLKFKENEDNSIPYTKHFSMSVDISRIEEIEQMLQALNYFEHLDLYFEKFASWIVKSMIHPVILQGAKIATIDEGKFVTVDVEIDPSLQKSTYDVVYKNLLDIFKFFQEYLNIKIADNVTLLNRLGEIIASDFNESLLTNCLADTIPSHSNQLGDYCSIIVATQDLQSYLKTLGFLKEDDTTLQDYTQNVEYLCANKTCRLILEKARDIMKKDLYDMMEVGLVRETKEEFKTIKEEDNRSMEPKLNLSCYMFEFPQCQISKSTDELLRLINQVLDECTASTDMCAVRLFYTARNIVELYTAVVPTYHQKFLETIPQQVALFHNNCMYLSHCLLTLGDKHQAIFPSVLKSHTKTFVDQVTELRSVGTRVFLKHMQTQRNQILDIIRNCGLATLRESANLTSETEKALRQCLRQLELLQSVWQNVLPISVYCKAIGCLLNSFVDDLISRVVTVEDIPADTARQLVLMFNIVAERAPQIFPEPKEVHRHVGKWLKFLELVLILGATMKHIDDRWANGKGPAALLFPPDQVKQLIRALFQSTERRSALLGKIK